MGELAAAHLPLAQLQPEVIERRQIERQRVDSGQAIIIQSHRSRSIPMIDYPGVAGKTYIEQGRSDASQG